MSDASFPPLLTGDEPQRQAAALPRLPKALPKSAKLQACLLCGVHLLLVLLGCTFSPGLFVRSWVVTAAVVLSIVTAFQLPSVLFLQRVFSLSKLGRATMLLYACSLGYAALFIALFGWVSNAEPLSGPLMDMAFWTADFGVLCCQACCMWSLQ